MVDSDSKYIVFKREDFTEMLRFRAWSTWPRTCSGTPRRSRSGMLSSSPPGLFRLCGPQRYASSIAIAAKLTEDDKKREELIAVADYFQRQSELVAEEGLEGGRR